MPPQIESVAHFVTARLSGRLHTEKLLYRGSLFLGIQVRKHSQTRSKMGRGATEAGPAGITQQKPHQVV